MCLERKTESQDCGEHMGEGGEGWAGDGRQPGVALAAIMACGPTLGHSVIIQAGTP